MRSFYDTLFNNFSRPMLIWKYQHVSHRTLHLPLNMISYYGSNHNILFFLDYHMYLDMIKNNAKTWFIFINLKELWNYPIQLLQRKNLSHEFHQVLPLVRKTTTFKFMSVTWLIESLTLNFQHIKHSQIIAYFNKDKNINTEVWKKWSQFRFLILNLQHSKQAKLLHH